MSVQVPVIDSATCVPARPLLRLARVGLALAAVLLACATQAHDANPPFSLAEASEPGSAARSSAAAPPTSQRSDSTPTSPILLVNEPADLARWDDALDMGALLFDAPRSSTKKLRRSRAYRSLVADIFPDGLPKWWLGHPRTYFTLVGVVNRLDRRDMRPGTCGETRLIYRLEHRSETDRRRLPASFNVVFEQPDDGRDCAGIAKSWFGDAASLTDPGHPLHPERLALAQLLAIEVNLRDDDPDRGTSSRLSVHEYVADERRFQRAHLEFEPSATMWKGRGWNGLAKLLTSPELIESVRVGTPNLGGKDAYGREWDATFATPSRHPSMLQTTLARAGVKPDVAPFQSEDALNYRMQTLSCSGCHRQRSVAGFHLPGVGEGSSLLGGASAHVIAELPWREAYVTAVASGETPDIVRKDPHAGPVGGAEHCSTAESPVADLKCSDDERCAAVPGERFGVCLPADYDGAGPCDGDDERCMGPSEWFPGGFIARACAEDEPCAAVGTADDLRACRRAADPWRCVAARAARVAVDVCEDQAGCRDGYACTRLSGVETGVCIPEAAIPELRSAGHARVVR